jgi:hypothetical protein
MEDKQVNRSFFNEASADSVVKREKAWRHRFTYSIIMYHAVPILGTSSLTCRSNIGTACHIAQVPP